MRIRKSCSANQLINRQRRQDRAGDCRVPQPVCKGARIRPSCPGRSPEHLPVLPSPSLLLPCASPQASWRTAFLSDARRAPLPALPPGTCPVQAKHREQLSLLVNPPAPHPSASPSQSLCGWARASSPSPFQAPCPLHAWEMVTREPPYPIPLSQDTAHTDPDTTTLLHIAQLGSLQPSMVQRGQVQGRGCWVSGWSWTKWGRGSLAHERGFSTGSGYCQ